MKRQDLKRLLKRPEGAGRTAAIAAWFQGLYGGQVVPVLVGGAAVELYTRGAYTTGDLDFVGHVPAKVASALVEAGFRQEGRHWVLGEGELFLELPGSQLDPDERPVRIDVDGIQVLALSPEDMIVDRLAAWQFWDSATDGVNAFLIWKAQEESLDEDRLTALAGSRRVEKTLARLRELAVNLRGRRPTGEELETWVSQRF